MKIVAFRIQNFRSIVDTKWCPLSQDGVTVLVGQNESGKSSILEALAVTFSEREVGEDDVRTGSPLPEIALRVQINWDVLAPVLQDYDPLQKKVLRDYLEGNRNQIDIRWNWHSVTEDGKRRFEVLFVTAGDDALEISLAACDLIETSPPTVVEAAAGTAELMVAAPASPVAQNLDKKAKHLTPITIADVIYELAPDFILFSEGSGLLPDQIEINEKYQPIGNGASAAYNYLRVAGIQIKDLLSVDRRERENVLSKANALVTEEFTSFWSQTIGHTTKLTLRCDVDYFSDSVSGKAGKAHLVFWISDGYTQLYPKQRSQGVRWFVSFFLQLKASESRKQSSVFLLDEPGANLHAKAQADVLKLINKLREQIPIVYSTHSPHLIEYDKLYRIHAVQRNPSQQGHPTVLMDAHRLGAASTDTLSPILTAMGSDLSTQQVIRKENNVLLEEISGFYYLRAFWILTKNPVDAHFIACTGVNKIEAMANMFLGWGLDFIVIVDDDAQGRSVYKDLKNNLYGDDDKRAKQAVFKISNCSGIEDVFSKDDFIKNILHDKDIKYETSNSDYLKKAGRSKPVLAFQFKLAVEKGTISMDHFDAASREKIADVVKETSARLKAP